MSWMVPEIDFERVRNSTGRPPPAGWKPTAVGAVCVLALWLLDRSSTFFLVAGALASMLAGALWFLRWWQHRAWRTARRRP